MAKIRQHVGATDRVNVDIDPSLDAILTTTHVDSQHAKGPGDKRTRSSIAFLVENFDTNIIVKEVDKESVFQTEVLPIFEEILEVDLWKNFHHIFERSEEPLFHRQRVLNEMIAECETDIVVNYDCDVILPMKSYELFRSISRNCKN